MRFRELTAAAAITVAAVLFLGGCGSSDDNSPVSSQDLAKIQVVAKQLNVAVATANGARFCSFMQPSRVKVVFGSKARCAKQIAPFLKEAKAKKFRYQLDSAKTTGPDKATVTLSQHPPAAVPFVEENGAWYIDLSTADAGAKVHQ